MNAVPVMVVLWYLVDDRFTWLVFLICAFLVVGFLDVELVFSELNFEGISRVSIYIVVEYDGYLTKIHSSGGYRPTLCF